MNITENRLVETHYYQRSISIENVAPILLERQYSHGGKEFLPDIAHARWNHGEPIKHITLGGYVLKKDRTTGQSRAKMDYITPEHKMWARHSDYYTPAPEWLLDLFADSPNTTPEGAAA